MILQLTEAEANTLITLLDIAVKTKGLEVAQSCDFYFNKLKIAHAEEVAKMNMTKSVSEAHDRIPEQQPVEAADKVVSIEGKKK